MPIQQNKIMLPPHRHIKVAILIDPNTKQTELKIVHGQLTHMQLVGVLLEHATTLYRQMLITQQNINIIGSDNNNDEGGQHAS